MSYPSLVPRPSPLSVHYTRAGFAHADSYARRTVQNSEQCLTLLSSIMGITEVCSVLSISLVARSDAR